MIRFFLMTCLPVLLFSAACTNDDASMNEVNINNLGEDIQNTIEDSISEGHSGFVDTGPLTYFYTETQEDSAITMMVEGDVFTITIDDDASGEMIPRVFEVHPGDAENFEIRGAEPNQIEMIHM